MLMPKKTKFRKVHKTSLKGLSKGAQTVAFGEYGLKAVTPGRLTARQIEAMRVTLSRHLKKAGSFYLRVFPDMPMTKKPAETRMGKGKGNPEYWVAVVKRSRVVCEVAGVEEALARKVLKLASIKLPIKTSVVKKDLDNSAK